MSRSGVKFWQDDKNLVEKDLRYVHLQFLMSRGLNLILDKETCLVGGSRKLGEKRGEDKREKE